MKLTDKRFWMWIVIIAIMPVMMGVFTGCFLVDTFSELFYYQNIELFFIMGDSLLDRRVTFLS